MSINVIITKNKCKKVIVAMSGGVDSSISAWLLKKNYHVEGLFMKNWEEDDSNNYCASKQDLSDAQSVCDQLGIYLHKVNFSKEYWEKVFKFFLLEIKKGNTPNPDILCNKEIKFSLFFKFALEDLEADYIATGHYARILCRNKKNILLRGIDKSKDQSYFLYTLTSHKLKKILFPVGKFKKSFIRSIAEKLNLEVAHKKDSTGICFINPKNFNQFLMRYLPIKEGNILTVDDEIIGKHPGVIYYTLGQRRRLKIGGIKKKNNLPWYVIDKNINTNSLYVAQGNKNYYLMSKQALISNVHWIDMTDLKDTITCSVKIRYQHSDVKCHVIPISNKLVKILFDTPVSSVTPGQSAVFYQSEMCIGGGIIIDKC